MVGTYSAIEKAFYEKVSAVEKPMVAIDQPNLRTVLGKR